MNFNEHWNLRGKHALFSPSSPYWIRYDQDRLESYLISASAKQKGTELHDLASRLIKLKINLPRNNKTLNRFVNDCIGYQMTSEQILYYSEYVFGTADAISFRRKELKIFDLKTGTTPAKMDQLKTYAALFCMEYKIDPYRIKIELRIYQNDDIEIEIPDPNEIDEIMTQIVKADEVARRLYFSSGSESFQDIFENENE